MTRTVLLLVLLSVVASASPAPPSAPLHDLLRRLAGMNGEDLAALDRGEAVARVVDTDRRQVAVIGAVRVRTSRERLVERYRDLNVLARTSMILQIGAFSETPRATDLAPLVFENYDIESIRECEPGDCAVRLSAAAMQRFQQEVHWRTQDWRTQVADLWRQSLAEYALAYRTNGDRALAEYHNKQTPLRMQEEFDILFRDTAALARHVPEFVRYLREYPRVSLPGTEGMLYWSKDNFGLRPVVTVNHLVTYLPPGQRRAMVATKQIYATHYFDAGLALTLMLDDGGGGYYVLSVNRVRTRSLTSFFRGFVRSTVQGRSRDGLEKTLRSLKEALEGPETRRPGRG